MSRAEEIESLYAAIEKSPDDAASYLVLSDALLEQGDPRGELIQIQHQLLQPGAAPGLAQREKALLTEHADSLIGAELSKLKAVRLRWRLGFLDEAELLPGLPDSDLGPAVRLVLTSPAARLLRSLVLAYSPRLHTDYPSRGVLRHLRSSRVKPPRSLRCLQLGAAFSTNPRLWIYRDYESRTMHEDLTGLLEVFDSLEELRVDLGVAFPTWGKIASDSLRSFEWVTPFLPVQKLADVVAARWPNLERLVLWTGGQLVVNEEADLEDPEDLGLDAEDFEGDAVALDPDEALEQAIQSPEQLEPLFQRLDGLERLRCFGLANFMGPLVELFPAIVAHPFWGRLEALDLSHSRVHEADAEALARAVTDAPGRLRELVVEGARMDGDALGLLQGLPSIALQGTPGQEDPRFRYVVTME